MKKSILDEIQEEIIKLNQQATLLTHDRKEKLLALLRRINCDGFDTSTLIPIETQAAFHKDKRAYVVIVGRSNVSHHKLLYLAEEAGFPRDQVKIHVNQDHDKKFPFDLCGHCNCKGVLIGPIAHNVKGNEHGNDTLGTLMTLNPNVIQLRNHHTLKMTVTNVAEGLKKLSERILMPAEITQQLMVV